MADGPTTKEVYYRVCSETKREPDGEILAVLNHAIDQQILWVDVFLCFEVSCFSGLSETRTVFRWFRMLQFQCTLQNTYMCEPTHMSMALKLYRRYQNSKLATRYIGCMTIPCSFSIAVPTHIYVEDLSWQINLPLVRAPFTFGLLSFFCTNFQRSDRILHTEVACK